MRGDDRAFAVVQRWVMALGAHAPQKSRRTGRVRDFKRNRRQVQRPDAGFRALSAFDFRVFLGGKQIHRGAALPGGTPGGKAKFAHAQKN